MANKTSNAVIWIIVGILILLGAFYLFRTPSEDEGQEKMEGDSMMTEETGPINIGVIAPLTGDAAAYGDPTNKTYQLAEEEINAGGGINGRQVHFIFEDGKCDGTTAATATQKLVNVDKVKFILGGVCSGETLAASEITQKARVLLLSPTSTSPAITDAGDLVFRVYPSDAYEAVIIANHTFDTLGLKKAAVVSENTDYGQGIRKAFKAAYKGEIVADETYNTGETDFRTIATKIAATDADFIYVMPQTATSGELALKQLREAGFSKPQMLAQVFLDDAIIKANPDLYEGSYIAEVPLSDEGRTKHFLDAYKERFGEVPPFTPLMAATYDSAYLLFDAIAHGASTGERAAKYFNENVKDFDGAIGTFNFDANGDGVLQLHLIRIKDGAFDRSLAQ